MKQNIIRNMTTLCSKQFSGDETSLRAFDSLNDCGSDQYWKTLILTGWFGHRNLSDVFSDTKEPQEDATELYRAGNSDFK